MRPGLSVRAMLVVVAFVAVFIAAFRQQSPFLGFGASVSGLAVHRTRRTIVRSRASGVRMTPRAVARTFLVSMAVAATLVFAAVMLPLYCLMPHAVPYSNHSGDTSEADAL